MSSPSNSASKSSANCEPLDVSIWYRRVYALCQAKLISRSDAEDAAQETFARGLARRSELRSPHAIGVWLRGIAHNVCVDTIRRNKVRRTSGEAIEAEPVSTTHNEQLVTLITELPEPLREVVLLHYYDDMTYDQMADWLGVARSTVSDRLNRARTTLKNKLLSDRSLR